MTHRARWGAFIFALAVLIGPVSVAGAQDGPDPYVGPSPTVEGTVLLPPEAPKEVQSATASTGEVKSARLALTGADVGTLAIIGSLGLVAGTLVLVARRNRAVA